jgi:hypothetical protein
MTLEKVLYTVKVRTTGSWKDIFMKHPLLRLAFVTLLAAHATPSTVWAQVQAALQSPELLEKSSHLQAAHSTFRHLRGVHVDVKQPLTTYKQIPSDLSHVTSASYVGVAST